MGARKSSFRLLSALAGAVFVLFLALSCVLADPNPTAVYMPYMACEHYNSPAVAKWVWLEHRERLLNEAPYPYAVNLNPLWDENGQWIEGTFGIVLRVVTLELKLSSGDVEVTTLECLDGVPVQTAYDSLFREPNEPLRASANPVTAPECTRNNTAERREEVYQKYETFLKSYPNSSFHRVWQFHGEHGVPVEGAPVGIVIRVYPWVDPDTLPPEDRIPDCLEGIPIQILEGGKLQLL